MIRSRLAPIIIVGIAVLTSTVLLRGSCAERELQTQMMQKLLDAQARLEKNAESLQSCDKEREQLLANQNARMRREEDLRETLLGIINMDSRYKRATNMSIDEAVAELEERAIEREERYTASKKLTMLQSLPDGRPPHYWGMIDPMLQAMEIGNHARAYGISMALMDKSDLSAHPYHYAGRVLRQLSDTTGVNIDGIDSRYLRERAVDVYDEGLRKYPEDERLLGGRALVSVLVAQADNHQTDAVIRPALILAKKAMLTAPERSQWFYLIANLYRLLWLHTAKEDPITIRQEAVDFLCTSKLVREIDGRRKRCAVMLDDLGHVYQSANNTRLAGEYMCRASTMYDESELFRENCRYAHAKGWVK